MLYRKCTRKATAALLLLTMLVNLLAPTAAYALTAGPTQPEATSFEPIDTTDMVNPQTGDFTYNIPLLEIPGPEGGYPLSLSYHADIQPNVDASWVGLGWTINPGAIDRSVNGYPDDWYEPTSTSHVYWAGGNTTTYDVGVSVGIANTPATVNFGLSFAHDTYRGFGVGVNEGIGANFQIGGVGLNASIGFGVGPYGGSYMTGGVGVSAGPIAVGVSAATNFKSLDAGFSYGLNVGFGSQDGETWGGSLIGSTISTAGGKPSLSIGGLSSSISNSKSSQISTSSHGFNIDIPVYYGINLSLGYSKERYWTDETASVTTWGSLNNLGSGNPSNNGEGWDNFAYDEYSLLENPSYLNSAQNADPTVLQGGSFPDFDEYDVNAQGLGGSMRPYMFQGRIANQNLYNGSTPLVQYYMPGVTNNSPFFRFEGDFSNSYRQAEAAYPNPALDLRYVVPPMDGIPVYGNGDGNYGYAGGSNLAGSKHVDIGPLIHPRFPVGYNKADKYQDYMIEGFSITNESGMTYHFGLPAYSSNEQDYQELINPTTGATGNRVTKPNQYAYMWYLTTITGPDFVDRNGDGIADDGDWGYWVDFEYGKWSNTYNWRNPGQGFQRDQDPLWQDVSMGTKEVYYLNAIRTRTHVAIFEKDIRYDGKGTSPESFNTVSSGNIASAGYANQGLYDVNSSQSLQLSHIYLLNASDENFVTTTSGNSAAYQPTAGRTVPCTDCELAQNVLDRTDVDAVGRFALEAKAIRIIDFNYNYSLCPNTANSFDINNPSASMGKLTLLNFVDRGKGGANLLPPMTFTYDFTTDGVTQTGVSLSPGSFTTTSGSFNVGDMIMESATTPVYCGVVTAITQSGGNYTYTLANGNYTGSTVTATVYTTKNPPYEKDAYDSWGNYKSDYNLTAIAANENVGRITTPISATGVDAWSLRTITSQMGGQIKINYGSDQISQSVLNTNYSYPVTSLAFDGANNLLKFMINTYGYPIANILQQGNVGNIIVMAQFSCMSPPCNSEYITEFPTYPLTYTINSITTDGYVHVTLSQAIPSSFTDPQSPPGNGLEVFSQLITANISAPNSLYYGGGLRVNSITKINSDNTQDILSYNYNNPATGLSSGVTSFMPSVMDADNSSAFSYLDSYLANIAENDYYKPALNSDVNYIYSIAREVPAPAVIYQYVTVTNQVKNPDEQSTRTVEGSTQYQFETYNSNMVGIVDVTPRTGPIAVSGAGNVFSRNLAMMKFTGSIGNVKRIVQLDPNGNKLSETINHYLHDNLTNLPLSSFMSQYKALLSQYNYQGYLQERFYEIKQVSNQTTSSNNGIKATLSAREEYPCIQTGQTQINYVNGTQASSTNLAFDFYSGAVTQTLETDAYGNNVMSQTIPAYRKYSAMGLKINNDADKNMLTQTAETYSWKVDANNNTLGLISASATTWSDNFTVFDPNGNTYTQNLAAAYGDVWREQSEYNWLSGVQTADGTTPVASFSDFDWAAPASSNANWKNTSTATLYDVYSKGMEGMDVNNIYSAMHLNYGDQKVILTGSPANFYEIAYSGAEDANISQTSGIFVNGGSGTIATGAGVVHTGAQSLLLNAGGTKGFTYSVPTANLTAGRTYQASVWVKAGSGTPTVGLYYDIDGTIQNSFSSANSVKTANGWILVNLVINGSSIVAGHTLNVWCRNDNTTIPAYVDDFRFQPVNSSTKAYVYDPFSGELDYVLDNSNLYTEYVYDGAGRLTAITREKLNVGSYQTNQYQYNYGATQYTSAAISANFAKDNCTTSLGDAGVPMLVTVPAGMFNSFISQADANNRAQIYAQDYANLNGSCSCQPVFTYASGITPTYQAYTLSGTTTNFTFAFAWPAGYQNPYSTVTIGNVTGGCGYPSATRTIPVYVSGTTYDVIINTIGVVQVEWASGPAPSTGQVVGLNGTFDLLSTTYYSAADSGTFQRNNCPSGQTGSSYTYRVIPYEYSSTVSQTAANQLAINDVAANGQNNANVAGTCNPSCGFTFNSSISYQSAGTFTTNGTTVTFNLEFPSPTAGYLGGTVGTITGACLPATSFNNLQITDQVNPNRVWLVTVTSAGVVSISLMGSTSNAPALNGEIIIAGSYALSQ